ncbi:hypothetical protein Q428_00020 [Fervidicella metallireducens AeB]|uniref:Peptidase M20 domain-containing protein 2 n=1 Tax=Fervidicella metallireducens AeB TaxID=1403537 RepID=A0A017RYT5_9CLOT|nr:amidohydrolase [Fervidicella metallireducens]EYE89847.1 hypothetical protein Q428_00020 [Fervidicella metallireducens AeB]
MSNAVRAMVAGYVENFKDKLEYIVDTLYKNPELSFNEEKSSEILISILKDEGFKITENVANINYSFKAEYGSSSPKIAYLCEYDAVKNMGHANGHNITSAINLGAAVGLKRGIEKIGGSVVLIGCPAENKYPSKIVMLSEGVFSDVDAIICGHAMDKTCESGSSLGMSIVDLTFIGRQAHSSLNLKEGINAITPCVMLFNLIESLKNKYHHRGFINGIITNGGDDISLIPGEVSCSFMVKSADKKVISDILNQIINSADFTAKLYNCKVDYKVSEHEYLPLITNHDLSTIACHNLKERGIINIHGSITSLASLDIGNVSQIIPTIHPYIGICEEPTQYYSKEFADCTITSYAKENMLKAACALALTGIDIIQNPDIIKKPLKN